MSAAMKFNEGRGETMSSNEGVTNEVSKRLGALETSVATITATIPHLAKQTTVDSLVAVIPYLAKQTSVDSLAAVIPHLATKADLNALESKLIKWMVATVLTAAGLTSSLAFSIAKLVH